MRVVGIDPGVKTGMATFVNGKLVALETKTPYGMICELQLVRPGLIVVEDSRMQTHVWSGPTSKNTATGKKVARDVGRIDAICSLIDEVCEALDIGLITVSPLAKGAKLGRDEFFRKTGWTGRNNEHQRDAATVAWMYRNMKEK